MSSKYGIKVLHDPQQKIPRHQNLCDLVAIHGLNGDPEKTWTYPGTKVMWLKDFLPTALPGVRVMTYGYNAKLLNLTGHQDLRSVASKLLTELVDLRKAEDEKSRPIVLVCHSLGGVVAKKALIIGCPKEQKMVQDSVYGIMFMGTPHNGSSLAGMGKLLSNIVSVFTPLMPPRALIGLLQKESEVLMEINEDFLYKRGGIKLVSFYELNYTSIGFVRKLVVERRSAVLGLENETTIGQFADHRDIVRFKSSQDRSFRPVLSQLEYLLQDISSDEDDLAILSKRTEGNPASETLWSTHTDHELGISIPGNITGQPCSFFCGRENVLRKITAHFDDGPARGLKRRTFAICGLGGAGKTQTALHYIQQTSSCYDSGVAFVNATSVASLVADFERLYDLLQLRDAKNKTRAVISWLSQTEHQNWLLVFDNANDLTTVPLRVYIPAVHWGHILITSRDQAVIGSLTDNGHILSPLMETDAARLLLNKSGVQSPTEADIEDARAVGRLLGFLPLALVQAGAFIRSRHRNLRDYRSMYLTRREELLGFTTRLADSDQAVLTTWEINFRQVEKESPDAACLLLLFSFLEPSAISETLLHRGTSPQKRWTSSGESTEVSAQDEGIEKSLVRIIQGDSEFERAVENLLAFSLITCSKERYGLRRISIHPLVQYCAAKRLSSREKRQWRWQALLLPLYTEVGRTFLPHLSRVFSELDAMSPEHDSHIPFRHELASTLLAASRFSFARWKVEAIDRTKTLLEGDDDLYLNAHTTRRMSEVLRGSGKVKESQDALYQFPHGFMAPAVGSSRSSRRYNAELGELIISVAENLIRQGKLDDAKGMLTDWEPHDASKPSSVENMTTWARDTSLGKILRLQGYFHEALAQLRHVLEGCATDDYFEGTGRYRMLVSEVADLHCELDQSLDAEKLLLNELIPNRERGTPNTTTGRRLRMSLAETYLQRGMYAQAEDLLFELQRALMASCELDYNARIVDFRIWNLLARNAHQQSKWEQAISRWRKALSALKGLDMDQGFDAGIVRCSIAHALYVTGHKKQGIKKRDEARENMASEHRSYWIPIFGSQWHDYIVKATSW
ncbi:hypothetical protein BJX70DRAFT_409220 [Aspergillus crustosus]